MSHSVFSINWKHLELTSLVRLMACDYCSTRWTFSLTLILFSWPIPCVRLPELSLKLMSEIVTHHLQFILGRNISNNALSFFTGYWVTTKSESCLMDPSLDFTLWRSCEWPCCLSSFINVFNFFRCYTVMFIVYMRHILCNCVWAKAKAFADLHLYPKMGFCPAGRMIHSDWLS